MKKLFAILLSLCLMCGLLTACGGGETSSDDDKSNDSQVVNIVDFEGWWTSDSVDVGAFKINASDSTVTAYTNNGYKIATFPCVAKTDGVELKMSAFGNVTVSLDDLVVSSEPTVSEQVDVVKKWSGVLYTEQYLEFTADGGFKQLNTMEDYGFSYDLSEDKRVISFMGTKDNLNKKRYEIYGGMILVRVEDSGNGYKPSDHKEVYIAEDVASTDKGKAIANYYIFLTETWADESGESTVKFADNGKFYISETEMGIWYPSSTGVSIELADGTVDELVLSNGSFTINTVATTYTKQ